MHLLTLHEPGNELRIVPEINVPGGSIDYCLTSVRHGKPRDFVGIELQTMDTTGTVWPERQRFLRQYGVQVKKDDVDSDKGFGINWTALSEWLTTSSGQRHEALGQTKDLCGERPCFRDR